MLKFRFLIALVVATLAASTSYAEPWGRFEIATNFRHWGNAENYNMEKAFQAIGLPDDGCWENNNPYLACVITLDRRNEESSICHGVFAPNCTSAKQTDYLILYRFDAEGASETRFVKGMRYECKHPTGTDPWPKERCTSNRLGYQQVVDLITQKLIQSAGLRQLFVDRRMME